MNTKTISIVFLLLCCLPLLHAEWGTEPDDYILTPNRATRICADGYGGCWTAGYGIGHVDKWGNLSWEEGFYPRELEGGQGANFHIVLAGNHDLILGETYSEWEEIWDGRETYEVLTGSKVFLYQINQDLELLWGNEGLELDTSSMFQRVFGLYPGPVESTYLIHWVRTDDHWGPEEARLQLIDDDGEFLWGVNGISLNWSYTNSKIINSSDDGVIISQNVSPDFTIAVIKFNSEGEEVWDTRVSALGEDGSARNLNGAVSDGEGGVTLVNEYTRYEREEDDRKYFGINAMRVSADGDSLWTRSLYERPVDRDDYYIDPFRQCDARIDYVPPDLFFVAWVDNPRYSDDVQFVEALDIDGGYVWNNSLPLITDGNSSGPIKAVPSWDGICYTFRNRDEDRGDWWSSLWGQRINTDGERVWGDDGKLVQHKNVSRHSGVTDGAGGVIKSAHNYGSEYSLQLINRNGEIGRVLQVSDIAQPHPNEFQILSLYPNPFNSWLNISFNQPVTGKTSVTIYDLMGRQVANVMQGEVAIGRQKIIWNANSFPAGGYIVNVKMEDTYTNRKIVLMK